MILYIDAYLARFRYTDVLIKLDTVSERWVKWDYMIGMYHTFGVSYDKLKQVFIHPIYWILKFWFHESCISLREVLHIWCLPQNQDQARPDLLLCNSISTSGILCYYEYYPIKEKNLFFCCWYIKILLQKKTILKQFSKITQHTGELLK